MPQEHYVLRCFSCETFQAHIVKKAKKWECKMCGAKQSVKRNYGRGSAKDCRNQVMKLNELRLTNDSNSIEAGECTFEDDFTVDEPKDELNEPKREPNKPFTSKWEKYLEEPTIDSESEADESVTNICVASVEKKKKRLRNIEENYSGQNKKICRNANVSEPFSPIVSEELSPSSSRQNVENFKSNEKQVKRTSHTEANNQLKFSKYNKYLEDDADEESKNDSMFTSNIFDSDSHDLDNILNLD